MQTAVGSAVMLRDSGEHPVKLREAVTSPAGTTITPSASWRSTASGPRFSPPSRPPATAPATSAACTSRPRAGHHPGAAGRRRRPRPGRGLAPHRRRTADVRGRGGPGRPVAGGCGRRGWPRRPVVVTARNTAPYLLFLLALSASGAVAVPTNPRSAPAELAGLVGQVRPRLVVSDRGLDPLVEQSGVGPPSELRLLDVDEIVGTGAGPPAPRPAAAGRRSGRTTWPCSSRPPGRPGAPSW